MESNPERRDKTRFAHECKITLENSEIGVQRSCMMYNFNDHGLYIEADTRLEQETEIRIGINNSPFASEPDKFESYRGIIKWRKALKQSSYYYGYGVELIKDDAEVDQDQFQWSRENPRKALTIPVKFEYENRTYEGTTENVSTDGVAVKSKDPVMVGQPITLEIPLKKKGRIAKFQGKVSWSNRQGFGVKFVSAKKI
jgi:Tfp pilus assembly protein PilZ